MTIMEFPNKSELSNKIHKLVQAYRESSRIIKDLSDVNSIIKKENELLKSVLTDKNEKDFDLLQSQEKLIPKLLSAEAEVDKLNKRIQVVECENKMLKETSDKELQVVKETCAAEITKVELFFQNQLEKEKEKFELKEATEDLQFDQIKTDMQRMKTEFEEKLKETEYAYSQQRTENVNFKKDFREKEAIIKDLKEQVKTLNDRLRVANEKIITLDCKLNPNKYATTTIQYRNESIANCKKFVPLNIRNDNLRAEMSKMEFLTLDSNKTQTQKLPETKQFSFIEIAHSSSVIKKSSFHPTSSTIFSSSAGNTKSVSNFLSRNKPIPHQIPSVVIADKDPVADSDVSSVTSTSSTVLVFPKTSSSTSVPPLKELEPEHLKPKKRKLYVPNDFSNFTVDS